MFRVNFRDVGMFSKQACHKPPIIITLASIVAYYPGSNEHFGGL